MSLRYDVHTASVQMTVAPTTVTVVPDPDSYDKGYQAGETEGHKTGKAEGYADGHTAGRAEGYADGHTAGRAEGYADGHNEGFVAGEEVGYQSGKSDGYDEGYGKGHTEGYTKGEQSGYDFGFDEGQATERSAFWEDFQNNGNRTTYQYAFYAHPFTPNTFKPKYDMRPTGGCDHMFSYINNYYKAANAIGDLKTYLSECGVVLDTSQATSINHMFYLNQAITHLPTISAENCTNINATFFSMPKLVSIECLKLRPDGGNTFSDTFHWASYLADLTIEGVIGNDIQIPHSVLNKASFESVIGALSDTVSGKAATFYKIGKERAMTEAEWQALIATKPNWTISLV